MKSIKWGLIGCGDISNKRIAPALQELENCKLIAVTRLNEKLLKDFANKFKVAKSYKNWQDLIHDDEIEAVYIATPVKLHAPQSIAAAEAGKHVLCEKPMALNSPECDKMIQACKKNKVKLGISYYRHFYPITKRIKEIIASGEIGQPIIAEINAFEWFNKKPGEARSWLLDNNEAGGGPMMDFGSHRIELLVNLFGTVQEIQSKIYNLHFHREVEDTAYVSILFEKHILGIIKVTHAAYEPQDTIDIFGSKGTIRIPVLNDGNMVIKTKNGERVERLLPHSNIHLPLINDFAESILHDKKPAVDGQIGREITRILDQIYCRNQS